MDQDSIMIGNPCPKELFKLLSHAWSKTLEKGLELKD